MWILDLSSETLRTRAQISKCLVIREIGSRQMRDHGLRQKIPVDSRRKKYVIVEGTPEEFARRHNLYFPEPTSTNSSRCVTPSNPTNNVFSVDLSQMKSMKLFFSNIDATCGQLVIASRESQYKIFHFHHGGLDKLAEVFKVSSTLNFTTFTPHRTDRRDARQFSHHSNDAFDIKRSEGISIRFFRSG